MKKISLVLLIFAQCCFLLSCDKADRQAAREDTAVEMENSISIYYPGEQGLSEVEDRYQLKQPDSLAASVEEVLGEMLEAFGAEKVSFDAFILDDTNNLTLQMTVYQEADKDYLHIAKAAVAGTLFQLNDIESIRVEISGEENEAVITETMGPSTFYYYDEELGGLKNEREITLYVCDEAGTALEERPVRIQVESNRSIAQMVVEALAGEGSIPAETCVNSAIINSHVLYLDLDSSFLDISVAARSDTVLYSLVNSLTSIDGIDAVRLYVDGGKLENFRGAVDTSEDLVFNKELVK